MACALGALAFLLAVSLRVHAEAAPDAAAPLADAQGRRPNVLLVTVDTLRADHLGAYGYAVPTSPEIDRIAAEGVLFTRAITPVPTTAPALASLVTAQHVDVHRVRGNTSELDGELATLGEAFAAAGYATAGFFGNGAIREGFGQGLSTWEPFDPSYFSHDAVGTKKALAWLTQAKEPWFLWIHFMDPHGPYNSSPPAKSASFTYPADAALDREIPVSDKNAIFGEVPRYQKLRGTKRVVDWVRRYDGEILGTDEEVGSLRRALEERGLLDRTLIVVTADHGESLGEDDYFFQHGSLLNEASLRIPLVLRHPKLPAGRKIDAPASLIDVFPTLSSLLALSPPAKGSSGRDLGPAILDEEGGEAREDEERIDLVYNVTPARLVAVRSEAFELRGTPAQGERPNEQFERLDLFRVDGATKKAVSLDEHTEVVAKLRPVLETAGRRLGALAERPQREPSKEERDRLRALGYVD